MPKPPLEKEPYLPEGVYYTLAKVTEEPIAWLWQSRLALGKLTLLEGPPDLGKSTIALDLAARLTTGRPMPGEEQSRPPQSVAILADDDTFRDTLRPRLVAAGGDPERIVLMPNIIDEDDQYAPVTFPQGISALSNLIEDHDVKLIILDPFIAYFGTLNCYHDQHVRRGLSPLVQMARNYSIALLAVRNWTKDERRHVLYRGSGALGIVNAARTTLAALPDPVEPEQGLLRVVKSNLARKPADVRFALEDTGPAARVRWLGEVPNSNDSQTVLQKARDFLQKLLADGPVPALTAYALADQAGIGRRTLEKAKAALDVASDVLRDAKGARWQWSLPGVVGAAS